MYLNNIEKFKKYKIKNINTDEIIKRRFYDMGIISGAEIKLLYVSPSNKIKAYLVRNSLIAIRDKDALLIEVYYD